MAVIPDDVSAGEATKASLINAINAALADLESSIGGVAGEFLANGSFEVSSGGEPSNWTITDFDGGTHVIDTSNKFHGDQSLKVTTDATGGRSEVLSDDFIPVAEGDVIEVVGYVDSDTADIRTRAQILFYNAGESLIGTDTIYDEADTGLAWAQFRGWSDGAPNGAAFFKVKLIGGESGGSTTAGNINFDGISLRRSPFFSDGQIIFTSSGTFVVPGFTHIYAMGVGGGGGGGGGSSSGGFAVGGGGGGAGGYIETMLKVVEGETLTITIGTGGTGGAGAANVGLAGDGNDGVDTTIASGATTIMLAGKGFGGTGADGTIGGGDADFGIGGSAGVGFGSSSAATDGVNGGKSSGTDSGGDGGDVLPQRGTGGTGGTGLQDGGDGVVPGGAGGGGGGDEDDGGNAGGDGADGKVIFFLI